MPARVVVVTDSTAVLPPELAASAGVEVVPVPVVIDDDQLLDGEEGTQPGDIVAALVAKRRVSTSRPSPGAFEETYARLAAEGAEAIVSVHVTGEMSGTVESARLAARKSPVPVTVVDSLAVGPCLGLAAVGGAHAIAQGADAAEAAALLMDRANHSTTYLYVDTLEFLRRGGRIGAGAALLEIGRAHV
jgi:DegV family protein with EDD domain